MPLGTSAELRAAFLCADLGVTNEFHTGYVQHLAYWLDIPKGNKRAIFTAASKAAQSADFLYGRKSQPAPLVLGCTRLNECSHDAKLDPDGATPNRNESQVGAVGRSDKTNQ